MVRQLDEGEIYNMTMVHNPHTLRLNYDLATVFVEKLDESTNYEYSFEEKR